MPFKDSLSSLWTSTGFVSKDLSAYAEGLVAVETRQGVVAVSLFSLLLLGGAGRGRIQPYLPGVPGAQDSSAHGFAPITS